MAELNSTATTATNTIVGYFRSHSAAESAIRALQSAGFQANEVGVAANSGGYSGDSSNSATSSDHEVGFWDKVRNFFDGNTAEPYADERSRGDLATREITTSDSSSAYGSSYGTEDVHGSLGDLQIPDGHARYFGDKLRSGGALVTVSAGDRAAEAVSILEANGADLGNETQNFVASDEAVTDRSLDREDTDRNIRLYGEVLRVQKDRISRGEVRIRKEVLTDTQTIEVPVTREELVLERVAVDGKPAASDATFGKESEIRIPLTEERARVDKQAVVLEEVHVGKRVVGNVESFDEQVRREELRVEDETKSRGKAS